MMPNLSARPPAPSPGEVVAPPAGPVEADLAPPEANTLAPAAEVVPEAAPDLAPADARDIAWSAEAPDSAQPVAAAAHSLDPAQPIAAAVPTPNAGHDIVWSAPAPPDGVQGVALPPRPAAPPARAPQPVFATTLEPAQPQVGLSSTRQLPTSSNAVRDFVRQAATERGIDPDIAVQVVLSEGGLTPATWTGDHGSSFGPFQLHYGGVAAGGNAVGGLGDAFTAQTHLQASDPTTWRQQVEWALDQASRTGWTPWHGAAGAGIGPHDGIGSSRSPGPGPIYAGAMLPANAHPHVQVPNQFASQLSVQDAYAACGPVAAVAVARFLGRNPTVSEALQLAKSVGWTAAGGMNGIANEKKLLDTMHIPSQMETTLSWRHVQTDAAQGTPVIISTPDHYWVVDDYDPVTGEYHVGQSGLAYRGGAEWMTAERIQQLGGGMNGGLYIDHPLASHALPVTATGAVTMAGDIGWQTGAAPPPGAALAPPGVSDLWWENSSVDKLSAPRGSAVQG